jgi:hypothetical protein
MQLLPDNEMEVGLFVRDQWTKCSMWLRRCFGITIAPDTMVCALHALRMCLQESELWRCLVTLFPVLPSYPPPPRPVDPWTSLPRDPHRHTALHAPSSNEC